MLRTYLAVMAGGAAGVALRMFLSGWIAARWGETFPWGTITVNVAGCLAIGVFAGLTGTEGVWLLPPLARQVVTIGVLGGFTTYSSFSLQTIELLAEGEVLHAMANVIVTLVLCLAATWAGLTTAAFLQPR